MHTNLPNLLCFEFHQLPERCFCWCREAVWNPATFAMYFQFQMLCRNRREFLPELLGVETLEHSSKTGNKKAQSKRSDDYLLRCVL